MDRPFYALSRVAFVPILLLPLTSASGQEVRTIRGSPGSEGYEIFLEHVLSLGERDGPGRVMRPDAMARDSRGNYLVAHGDGAGAAKSIWVFDPNGAFQKSIGRKGEGPGEYMGIGRMDVLQGDTLIVFDRVLLRRTTLSPTGQVIETQPYQAGGFFDSTMLPDGRMVLNQHFRTPESVGYPLQLLSADGRVIRSLGAVNPEYRTHQPVKYRRMVLPGPDGGSVWSVGRGDYLFELWDTLGARKEALQREADWFVPFVADGGISADGPPPPTWLRLAQKKDSSRVWVVATVPRRDWREVASKNPDVGSNLTALFGLYDWVVELVDLEHAVLVASTLFEGMEFVSFLGREHLVSYREDESGYPFLDVWHLTLSPPTPPAPLERRDP